MKIIKSITIDSKIAEFAETKAKKQNRSFSNFVESLVSKAVKQRTDGK